MKIIIEQLEFLFKLRYNFLSFRQILKLCHFDKIKKLQKERPDYDGR